jgi:hypothetical protein
MRRVRNVRPLAEKEKFLARQVFRRNLPYDRILISDGLGYDDRQFTVPTSLPATFLFNVDSDDYDWVLHVGDGYYGMSYAAEDKATLIHELTHVWQGEHSSYSWNMVVRAGLAQADLGEKAYEYDHRYYRRWTEYNYEQQASIVEDWFKDGMVEDPEKDLRSYYIKRYIRGERVDRDWIAESHVIRPLEAATLHVDVRLPSIDGQLIQLLEPRFAATDRAGYGARSAKLEALFRQLSGQYASELLPRLTKIVAKDRVSELFHDRLSTELRNRLVKILQDKGPG